MLHPKYRLFSVGLLLLVSSLLLVHHFSEQGLDAHVAVLQKEFVAKEKKLRANVHNLLKDVHEDDSPSDVWENTRKFRGTDFHYFLYRDNQLINWTSSTIPLPEFLDLTQQSGAYLLPNGWYYLVNETQGMHTAVGLFLIKNEFPYENESLRNHFHEGFHFPFQAELSVIPDEYNISNAKGEFIFSLAQIVAEPVSDLVQFLFIAMMVLATAFLVIWLGDLIVQSDTRGLFLFVFILCVLALRWYTLYANWADFFDGYTLFNPQLFGSSEFFPTLGDLFINVTLIWALVWCVTRWVQHKALRRLPSWIAWLLVLLFFVISFGVSRLVLTIVADSDIPLALHKLLELNLYSYVVMVVLAVVLWAYFLVTRTLVIVVRKANIPLTALGVGWFVIGFGYAFVEIWFNQPVWIALIFPLVLSGILFWIESRHSEKYSFSQVILLLLVFSGAASLQLDTSLWLKEQQSREVYAKKLISDKDLNTEVEFVQLEQAVTANPLLNKAVISPEEANIAELKKHLLERYFTEYWERFELDFFLFTADSIPVGIQLYSEDNSFSFFEEIIHSHAEQSDLSEHLYYVVDYTDKLSYVARLDLTTDSVRNGFFVVTLRSKIVPQDIGFPRLLLHEDSKVFFPLENYSMAKYVKGKLVSRFGAYHYPLESQSFLKEITHAEGYSRTKETSHYVLKGDYNRMLVLSRPLDSTSEKLTGFSFLFTTFGLFLLITLLIQGRLIPDLKKIKLALRIQLMMIALVFFALLFFSIGTGSFVKEQYDEYRDGLVREKLSSVQMELVQKLGFEKELKRSRMGNYMQYLLQKFSGVFMTDINLYSTEGNLLASSRPEVYELGLVSELMNPRAFRQMSYKKRSMFIHEETIGDLRYLSAYVPLQNNLDEVIGFINLPYFAKQNEFENEIASFLSAIINVFLFLLALSVVASVIVTNRITNPLKQIQSSLAGLELGKSNKPIRYKGNDEIGALVKEYNAKLGELEDKAAQLAQNERELAWREMAKQVAHEIKNPLTPMKLRLQHLQRSFNPDDPNAMERLNQVANSIIEQIDTLTHIANEFSNFAKLPRPNEEKLNIAAIIRSVHEMFTETENCTMRLDLPSDEVWVLADKDLMIRVFNNLIKNAVQAIPADRRGEITIHMQRENTEVCIRVADNGVGIPEELRERIFTPNFTTKTTGMGLGLAMVKQIVDSHGGRISFDTVTNQGTQFEIRFPLV
jgi:two-component system, NtrC family, nitrogen regulation sensor histidine kinase NtrY